MHTIILIPVSGAFIQERALFRYMTIKLERIMNFIKKKVGIYISLTVISSDDIFYISTVDIAFDDRWCNDGR